MAIFVGQDIRFREGAALRSELRAQIVEKAEIEIDLLVTGAVERADLGCCAPQAVWVASVKRTVCDSW